MAGLSAAAIRAADSLLNNAGGRTVLLRLPAPAVPADGGEQLGLAVPQFQDVALAPVVFRRLRPRIPVMAGASDGLKDRATITELLVSATAVEAAVGSAGMASADVLFQVAFGVVIDTALMEIESVTWSELGGSAYLYRLVLRTALAMGT